jgi:hypothetical protein
MGVVLFCVFLAKGSTGRAPVLSEDVVEIPSLVLEKTEEEFPPSGNARPCNRGTVYGW